MFSKKSRLERENDALEERISVLELELNKAKIFLNLMDQKWLRLLREYRYTQKACERRKRANKRLRAMLDDVGWPKNDILERWRRHPADKRPAVLDEDGKPKRLVPRKLP